MPPKKRPRTALAEIYGHPRSNLPVASVLKTIVPFSTRLKYLDFLRLRTYQKRRFRGFSAAQLHAIDALAATDIRSHDVLASLPGVAIHPMISKNKWRKLSKHLAKWPLRGGREGYWDVDNEIVWNTIEPAFKLISHFLECMHFYSWWEALANGFFKEIPVADKGPEDEEPRFRFFRRPLVPPGTEVEAAQKSVELKLQQIYDQIQFSFHSGCMNCQGPNQKLKDA